MATELDTTLTPPQVAKYLHVRRMTVLDWIYAGELKAVDTSNGPRPSYRVTPEDLKDFMQRRSNRAAVPTPLGRPRRRVETPAERIANRERTASH